MDIYNIGNGLEKLNSSIGMSKKTKGFSEHLDIKFKTCKHNYGFINKAWQKRKLRIGAK